MTAGVLKTKSANWRPGSVLGAILVSCPFWGSEVFAQDAGSSVEVGIGEIIVTAQKTKQKLQDVPMVITALDDTAIERRNVTDAMRIAAITPGVVGAQVNGVPNLTIRGIGTNDFGIAADPAVAFFVDGVYAGRTGQVAAGLFDIERVEVIKGPQGSLFGRSAAAGAISVITKGPSAQFGASGEIELGSRGTLRTRASVTGPLIGNKLLFRLSAMYNKRNGYNKDTLNPNLDAFDGIKDSGVRGSLKWVGDKTTITLVGDYVKRRARGNGFQSALPDFFTGIPADPYGPIASDLGADAFSRLNTYSASLTIDSELTDAFSVHAISAFRGYKWFIQEDDDATAFQIVNTGILPEKSNSYSQEVRLDYKGNAVTAFLGASFSRENASSAASLRADLKQLFDLGIISALTRDPSLNSITLLGLPDVATPFQETSLGRGRFDSYSLYGEVNWALSSQINVIAGLRWSKDRKRWSLLIPASRELVALGLTDEDPATPDILTGVFLPRIDPAFQASRSFSAFQPRLVVQYHPSDPVMLYASASRGYKPGGFNTFGDRPPFDAEYVWNYEAGLKSDWFDRRLRFNISLFRYNYTQLQVSVIDPFVGQQSTLNAGVAKGKGIESEVILAPVSGVQLGLSATYLDARYGRSANPLAAARLPEGNRLMRAPKLQATAYMQIDHDIADLGKLEWFVSAKYQSQIFFDPFNLPAQAQKPYTLVDGSLRWSDKSGQFSITLFGENIFNKRYLVNTEGLGGAYGFPGTQRGEPRRFGVRFSADI
jgi:iron complex outermembrane recepter protein